MEYENMTFLEAVKMLGERAGVALPQTSMSEEDRKERGIRVQLYIKGTTAPQGGLTKIS